MGLLICVLSLFGASALAALSPRFRGRGLVLSLLPLGVAAYLIALLPAAGMDAVATLSLQWSPDLGVEIALRADGLSLLFALLISGVGVPILIYSDAYMAGHPREGAFYSFMLLFMGSMMGLVLADDVVSLYVFFELTSVSSFLLIGLEHASKKSRRAAWQALIVTTFGGLALLVGVLLMGGTAGSYRLSTLAEAGASIAGAGMLAPGALLVMLAAFTKSAQFPFSFWLPHAMVAPTPVSAYLHSAAMVKAGIYLLARFNPLFADLYVWSTGLLLVGGVSFVFASWVALANTDMKRLLAFSTVAALGMMVMLLGLGTEQAVEAALLYAVVHACYKSALFMTAGSVSHAVHERDVRRLRGLRTVLPMTCAAAVLAGISMAGVPPTLGFVGKETIYMAGLDAEGGSIAVVVASVLGFTAVVAAAGVVAIRPWIGRTQCPAQPKSARESTGLWAPTLFLGVVGAGLGLAPDVLSGAVLGGAVSSVVGRPTEFELFLWHGLTAALAYGMANLLLGATLFVFWDRLGRTRPAALLGLAYERVPQWTFILPLRALYAVSRLQARYVQSGRFREYMLVCLVVPLVAAAGVLLWNGALTMPSWPRGVLVHEWVLSIVVVAGAAGALVARSRLTAIMALTASSYGIAVLFLLFGAPDLALTQFLVETLVAVLVVVAFADMPGLHQKSPWSTRIRDMGISVLVGCCVTAVILVALQGSFDPFLSDFFARNAYSEAHARNIVAAILTDFRALDTLGEIAVLAAAGIGALVLLKLRPAQRIRRPITGKKPRTGDEEEVMVP